MPAAATRSRSDAAETLARARAGEAGAFGELVRDHQGLVFSLARHFTRNREAAEDLAQDVFLELYRSIMRIESPDHLVFWLRRVTSHRCIDLARRQAHRAEVNVADVPERPSPALALPDPFLGERLRQLVNELAPAPRIVVALRFQEDLDPREIAGILDMPVNTVKSHLRRAIEQLRGRLRPAGSGE
ncbi:MAG: RNA polymerase sigma factor [Vicinamibacterales bacterium]